MTKKSKITKAVILLVIILATVVVTMKLTDKENKSIKSDSNTSTTAPTDNTNKTEELYADAKIYTIGQDAAFQSVTLNVNNVKSVSSTSSSYGSPIFAEKGTKFVVINLTVTNTTPNPFVYNPFLLIDQKDRTYNTYEYTIGNIDNYIDGSTLSPSIPKTGNAIYQVPEDSKSLRLGGQIGNTGKAQFVQFDVE